LARPISDQQPVFIVGPSRSGTTMLGGCLNAVSDVQVADETHYFSDLRQRAPGPDSGELDEAARAVVEDYFLALTHRFYGEAGDPERGSMDRGDLRSFAKQLGGTPDAYFEAFCRMQADERCVPRWGEKTPRHVFEIPELLSVYPKARIVCMIRDPRAVVASYRDFKKGEIADSPDDDGRKDALEREQRRVRQSYHVVIESLMWKAVASAEQQALARFGPERIHVLRYEDLVYDPEATLARPTGWLGLNFDAEALSTVPIGTSSYRGITSDAGITSFAAERWRERMTPAQIRTVQLCTGSTAMSLGYAPLDEKVSLVSLIGPWLSLSWVSLRVIWANRSRMGGIFGALMRRVQALVQS
jgi:hypothetical protein